MKANTLMLRTIGVVIGIGFVWWAVDLYFKGAGIASAVIISLEGLMIVAGVVFERRRYQPKVDLTHGDWQKTGEKFKDPSTGKLMDVVFNAKTGQRDYVEISSQL